MPIYLLPFLFFALNLFDAVLTVYWVRNGLATEGNQLMSGLLDMGYAPFLTVKIAGGAFAALILWHWGNRRLARYGLTVVIGIYLGLMVIHFLTGLTVFGIISENYVNEFSLLSDTFLAFFN